VVRGVSGEVRERGGGEAVIPSLIDENPIQANKGRVFTAV
jgi:hypothetical protein